ncbi:MAG: hypothetical protein A2283_00600 [Lentisphaerae bacterium RIFOXYA12_FULL_48_11]|nr:MAG: hypothetical protein A2283_00600 [Lentisphaerae bacterium RIFOXYA12_FULL_48_11]
MTLSLKWIIRQSGKTQPRSMLVFSLLLIITVIISFIIAFPEETTAIVKKIKPDKPSQQLPSSPMPDPGKLDGLKAFEEMSKFLTVGPRPAGTEGAKSAAKYIAGRLKDFGIEPIIDEFSDQTPEGRKTFRNVLGELQGPKDSVIILLSHYDTKSGISADFNGANDSGSSTGLLLELARLLKQTKPSGATILFAFLDGEECLKEYSPADGLHGSRRLARTLVQNARAQKVIAVILMDMIGDANLNVGIPRNSSRQLTSILFDSAREENVRLKFSMNNNYVLDDHVPFLQAGMPSIDIIDFDYGSESGRNDYWHTTKDTIDKITADSLQTVGRVVIRMLNRISNMNPGSMSDK